MQAQLIPVDGGETIHLTKDVTVVGRKNEACDVCIERSSVSKLHCVIVKTDGLLFIRDLGSTNGTKVNGQRVTRGALLPGDELAFAKAKYRVHLGPDDREAGHDEATEMMTSFQDAPLLPLEEAAAVESGSESDVRLLSDDSIA
jgi:pSer/pThr/pTyr-binding forkhead associated (FHA) protein